MQKAKKQTIGRKQESHHAQGPEWRTFRFITTPKPNQNKEPESMRQGTMQPLDD